MQNVQRTCMDLRILLKKPSPGVYGTIVISPVTDALYILNRFQELSEWLICRVPGDRFIASVFIHTSLQAL